MNKSTWRKGHVLESDTLQKANKSTGELVSWVNLKGHSIYQNNQKCDHEWNKNITENLRGF